MYKRIALISTITLLSCNNERFVRKEINNHDITLQWYYKSYISNLSPDFIIVRKDGQEKEIYKATDVVTNVTIQEKNIIIKLFKPERGIVYTKATSDDVFGYHLILDSSATYDEYLNTPHGKVN